MKELKFLFLFAAAMVSPVVSAADYSVKAVVVDSVGNPEEFATWRIFAQTDSVKPIAGDLTAVDGAVFALLDSVGDYRLEVFGPSSEFAQQTFSITEDAPTADLGLITLIPLGNQLSEVTISAQRPLVIREIDRFAYDVTADNERTTSSLQDILRKVPLVTVDEDGTIRINGSTDFKIYKNGRPNNSFTNNAKDIFRAIPASSIKKIEVITDPGALEDAEGVGAILNIVTDNTIDMAGITGTLSLYGDTKNATPTPSLYLLTQVNKFTLSASFGYYSLNRKETECWESAEGIYQSTGNILRNNLYSYQKDNAEYGNLECSFEPDTLNLFTLEANFYNLDRKSYETGSPNLSDPSGNIIYWYKDDFHYPKYRYFDFSGIAAYQRRTHLKGETLTLSYQITTTNQDKDTENQYTDIVNMPQDYSGIYYLSQLHFIEQTIQFDWGRPINEKNKFNTGLKYIQRNNHTESNREYIGTINNVAEDFEHKTAVFAAYFDYRLTLSKLNFRVGLRYEYSHLSAEYKLGDPRKYGTDLNDFAPNAAISYDFNDANTIKLSYNRRISRPGIYYLDPSVRTTPLSTIEGNPKLNSASTDRITLDYSLIKNNFNLNLRAGYQFSDDGIGEYKHVIDQHTYCTYGNVQQYKGFFSNIYSQVKPWNKTTISVNLFCNYDYFRYPLDDLSQARWSYNAYLMIRQKLPWKLTLQGSASYWSGYDTMYLSMKRDANCLFHNLSMQRDFLKDDRLSVRMSFSNPFGPNHCTPRTYSINTDYLSEDMTEVRHGRSVGLSITYRFGSLNASVKKTGVSTANDDLSGGKL